MSEQHRQGDLLFIKVDENKISENTGKLRPRKTGTIREGELTGHKHEVIEGLLHEDEDGTLFVVAPKEGADVTHPEHNTASLGEGLWEVRIQQEMGNAGAEQVFD